MKTEARTEGNTTRDLTIKGQTIPAGTPATQRDNAYDPCASYAKRYEVTVPGVGTKALHARAVR